MSSVNVNIKGFDELKSRLRNMPAKMVRLVDAELQDGVRAMVAEAKQRAPADQGILRMEITDQKIAPLKYKFLSGAIYSAYVEFGTRSLVSVPPGLAEYAAQFLNAGGISSLGAKEAIFAWCKRKGIPPKAWYPIFLKIMIVGTKPQPFFFPAFDRIEPIIVANIKRALQETVA